MVDFTIAGEVIKLNEFSPSLLLSDSKGPVLGEVEIHVSGTIDEPRIEGGFILKGISSSGYSFNNCPVVLAITVKNHHRDPNVYGEITFQGGRIVLRHTTIVLQRTTATFSGDPQKPALDLTGQSIVEEVVITIHLRGSIDQPELSLTSQPPLAQEKLLAMLIAGKSYRDINVYAGSGQMGRDFFNDVATYIFLGGSENRLAEFLGLDSDEGNKKE